MTNEELAMKIKEGHGEYLGVLWAQVADFINMQAGKYLDNFPAHYRDLQGDMVSQAYFYYLGAFEGFDPKKGSFLTWLSYFLKSAFTDVIYYGRSRRQKADPLNSAVSLESLVDGAEDLRLEDMIIDDTAEAYYRRIEDADFWLSVNGLINEAIGHIRDDKGRDLVRYMFYNGCNIKEASKALYGAVPVPYEHYRRALRQLRDYLRYSTVKKKMKAMGLDDYVRGWGVRKWKEHKFTSSVELTAIRHIDKQLRREDIADIIK